MMKAYRTIQYLIVSTLMLYVLIAGSAYAMTRQEIFPFFAWNFFSHVPPTESVDYGLRLQSVNGEPLAEALYFEQAAGLLKNAQSVDGYGTIQSFGRALEASDQEAINSVRPLIEEFWLVDLNDAQYTIVRRRFDLLERWRHKAFLSEEPLATFSKATNDTVKRAAPVTVP